MKILIINSGSSSLKYQLIEMDTRQILTKGIAERIGLPESDIIHQINDGEKTVIPVDLPNHKKAVHEFLNLMTSKELGVIKDLSDIAAVGHRVLHGAEKFSKPVRVTAEVKAAIRECFAWGPLHNPPNLTGIEVCEDIMPDIPQVAIFDTAFHQTMPPKAYMYALPYRYYTELGVRRYGFHGTSHDYVSHRAAEFLGEPIEKLRIVTCHLGNGSSLAAVKFGQCVDTSMGLTPLSGIMMGTRTGDIDPAIVPYIMEKERVDARSVDDLMNKKSGMIGVSGVSSDFRDIQKAASEGNERAKLALTMFTYQCGKLIASYAAAMGGIDVLVFTAGIGENDSKIRYDSCANLGFIGIHINAARNAVIRGKEAVISDDQSPVKVLVIPTNEELAIAQQTCQVCGFEF